MTVQAFANIALVKYWGKQDATWNLPMTGSLSVTLDPLSTHTRLTPAEQDQLWLNGEATPLPDPIQKVLAFARERFGVGSAFRIDSHNHFPTAAGVASSASAYAALAYALLAPIGVDLADISRLARLGSGSACRSIYGGFAQWLPGHDHNTSYAVPLADEHHWPDLRVLVALVESGPKAVSSTMGMNHTVATSPLYQAWPATVERDLREAKRAIAERDLEKLGRVAEANALAMHATALAARPAVLYWQPQTLAVIQHIWTWRQAGLSCYATLDAGPNVKILCPEREVTPLLDRLQGVGLKEVLVCRPGAGPKQLAEDTACGWSCRAN